MNSGRRYNINCNDWVMTKFGPKIELFDHIDSWVGDWVAGVSLFGRKYSQSYGKYQGILIVILYSYLIFIHLNENTNS